jgi:glycosyltransferase involved in cell wall biosynthesis
MPPRVSIIVKNYNYAPFLRDAIDSALRHTYSNREVVVVDDGSTDGSGEIIRSYGDRVVAVFQENAGRTTTFMKTRSTRW